MVNNYAGVIRYSGFVEPLLDKNIYNLVKFARRSLPKSRIEIVTNGDVLNKERLIKLFKSGLDTILISVYDGAEDAIKFEKLCLDCKLESPQYVIRHRYLPQEKDFGITMSNRAGMMVNAEYIIKPLKKKLNFLTKTLLERGKFLTKIFNILREQRRLCHLR